MGKKFEIGPIPDGHSQASAWTLTVGGKKIPLTEVKAEAKYGTLSFGLRPEGHIGWAFEETGGGGAVTLLWSRARNGEILVGLLPEDTRLNLGLGQHLCVVGGFVEPGETHQNAAIREGEEEAGLGGHALIPLQGLPIVSNRLFIVANIAAGEGTHAFELEVPFGWLSLNDDGSYQLQRILGDGAQLKKAQNVVFWPWREAICRTPDALALSAIARILAKVL